MLKTVEISRAKKQKVLPSHIERAAGKIWNLPDQL